MQILNAKQCMLNRLFLHAMLFNREQQCLQPRNNHTDTNEETGRTSKQAVLQTTVYASCNQCEEQLQTYHMRQHSIMRTMRHRMHQLQTRSISLSVANRRK